MDIDLQLFKNIMAEARNNNDLLDSFSPNQFKSKERLIKHIRDQLILKTNSEIVILGGWYGSILIPAFKEVKRITLIDKDEKVISIAKNRLFNHYKNVDFMLVGDSFAQGYCVERRSNIAGILESKGSYAINLVTAGNGPLVNFTVIKEYIELLKPKNIIWIYFEGNDLTDLRLE